VRLRRRCQARDGARIHRTGCSTEQSRVLCTAAPAHRHSSHRRRHRGGDLPACGTCHCSRILADSSAVSISSAHPILAIVEAVSAGCFSLGLLLTWTFMEERSQRRRRHRRRLDPRFFHGLVLERPVWSAPWPGGPAGDDGGMMISSGRVRGAMQRLHLMTSICAVHA